MKQTTKPTMKKKRFIPDILSPNVISVIRLCLIPIFVLFFYLKGENMRFIAAGIFAVAAFTDFLDGFIARKYNKVTTTGKFLDPIADKVLVATALILLLTHEKFMDMYDWMPAMMGIFVAVIIARELIVSVFREIAADKQVVLAAGILGKAKTLVQDVAIIVLIICIGVKYDQYYPDAGLVLFIIGFVLFCIATFLTLVSGAEYIITNRKVFKK
jgi:CDP-diacylglycerol--glycerol-3-phosphate 3-phosphatidyltransferase